MVPLFRLQVNATDSTGDNMWRVFFRRKLSISGFIGRATSCPTIENVKEAVIITHRFGGSVLSLSYGLISMLHVLLLMRSLGLSLCKRGTMVLPQTAGQAFPPRGRVYLLTTFDGIQVAARSWWIYTINHNSLSFNDASISGARERDGQQDYHVTCRVQNLSNTLLSASFSARCNYNFEFTRLTMRKKSATEWVLKRIRFCMFLIVSTTTQEACMLRFIIKQKALWEPCLHF